MKTILVRHTRIRLLAMLVWLAPAAGHGQLPAGEFAAAQIAMPTPHARFQALLDKAVSDGLPGVSLRVIGPGIDFQGAAGVADLITGEPLTANHAMYTASLGKTFTATVALQLCEEGRLDLDKPVSAWLPADVIQRIPGAEKITLRHLLGHTSGLIDYLNDDKAWRTDFARNAHRRWTHGDVIPYLYDRQLMFEPGTDFDYSNSNYILVGLILERVSGQPLHTLIRERILAPLRLQYTLNGSETYGEKKRAHGYVYRRGRIIDTYFWYSHYGLADAGMHSTPAELALFIKSLLNTGMLLSQSMRAAMTNASRPGHPVSDYGLGIYVLDNPWGKGRRWYSHDGIDPGYQADMMYLADNDLTLVLCANASFGKANLIYEKLITAVVDLAMDALR